MIPARWKEDPLSGMLTVSAVILIALYGLEEWRRSIVATAQETLQTVAVTDTSCRLSTAGLKGETLVVSCPQKTLDETRVVAQTLQHPFQSVVIVANNGRAPL